MWLLAAPLLVSCYQGHLTRSEGCLPDCLAVPLSACPPPVGACTRYAAALPDVDRFCFDELTLHDEAAGLFLLTADGAPCAAFEHVDADTLSTDTFFDAAGRETGRIQRLVVADTWIIECPDGTTATLDPSSPECADDPWLAIVDPYALPCELGACPDE